MQDVEPRRARKPDLADHFIECSKFGRHLTLADESRFVITDDFKTGTPIGPVATAVAAIYSKDVLVAQAAVVPLGLAALGADRARRARFAELFDLIEERALSPEVQHSAETLRRAHFREAQIRSIEAELGGRISPARRRYRQFLDVVRELIDGRVSPHEFRDEFLEFTYAVAGRLDFGIYSFCLDRIFTNPRIPLQVKTLLVEEIIKYPPLIRRELLTNVLTTPGGDADLAQFVREMVRRVLGDAAAAEISILETLKVTRLSIEQIGGSLSGGLAIKLPPAPAWPLPA